MNRGGDFLKEKLYEYFLSRYKYDEKNPDDFDFSFNEMSSIDEFNDEFNKFIYMLDSIYYENNKMVTAINSYNILIPDNIIQHIMNLYDYASKNSMIIQKNIITDFLFTYFNTLQVNKPNNNDYKNAEKNYRNIMQKFDLKNFFTIFPQNLSSFYIEVSKYGIDNDMYISPEVVLKMMNNIRDDIKKNLIIEELLKNDKYCLILINYDSCIGLHKDVYLCFIKRILEQELGFNDVNSIFSKLLSNDCLSNDEIKDIINLYVIKTNNICNKYKDKKESFIGSLSEIDFLKKMLCEVLGNENLDDIYKQKLHECVINILSLKRHLLLDDEYIVSDMQEFSTNVTISDAEVQKFIDELKNNKFKIYSASSLDFDKSVESAIEHYSQFALQSIIPGFSIDSKSQTYSTKDFISSNYKYSFEKYYENLGREYTIANQKKLLNKMGSGYYIEMLKELSRTYNMQQNISISLLGNENFRNIINDLKKDINYTLSNDYQMVVGNILATELNINKILTKNSLQYSDNMVSNLDILFDKYIDNKTVRNGIMYLYYSLYEKSGPNLRNKVMHGTLINNNLNIPLMISFSCLIFTCWVLSEK